MILGISGSPRSKSTEYVCKQALQMLDELGYETEYWSVKGKQINFCTHCDYCKKGEGCVFNDDMRSLYPLLEEASAYVVSTPVYNGNVSGQLKTVMDRCRALFSRNHKVFRYKPVIAIAVGGDRAGGQETAIKQISDFYLMNGGLPISGGTFGANLGASFWSKDSLEGVMEDEEGFRSLQKTVKRLDKYIKENKK
ncbi:MAG: flavodoxin family protein [Candidatus Bathyarchaeota archaeon]|nr:flavodoxin family protein [Candidatus Bathyarchaeota archaeon]